MADLWCLWCGRPLDEQAATSRACTDQHETLIVEGEEALVLDAATADDGPRLITDGGRVWHVDDHYQRSDVTDAAGRLTCDGRLTADLTITDAGRAWLAEAVS
jgi:hypothetical protein